MERETNIVQAKNQPSTYLWRYLCLVQAGVRNIVIRTHCHQHRLTFREWITRLPWSRSDSIFARWLAGKIVFEQWWLFRAVAKKLPPQCWQTTFVLTSLVSICSCLPQTGQYWWKDFAVILTLVVIWNRCKNGGVTKNELRLSTLW